MAETIGVDPATAVPEPRFHPPGDKTACSAATLDAARLSLMATATITAGGTGVQRVVTSMTVSMCTVPSVLATTSIGVQILNGSTCIWAAVLSVASNGISPPVTFSGLNLLTSAATEVSGGFNKAVANTTQFVSISYHDIGV